MQEVQPDLPAYFFDPEHPFTCVPPLESESIANFLYRFRSAPGNRISSPSALGEILGIGTAINRWEKFFFGGRKPAQEEIEALSRVTRVGVDRLWQMFPPEGERSQPYPIRICAACCQESSYHRIAWQYTRARRCEKHQIPLIAKCPHCKEPFSIKGLLNRANGCRSCGMRFQTMSKNKRPITQQN